MIPHPRPDVHAFEASRVQPPPGKAIPRVLYFSSR